jgi:hypothetical protein
MIDADSDDVTAAQLAVDRQFEQGQDRVANLRFAAWY